MEKILFDKSWLIGLDGLGCVVKLFIGSSISNFKIGVYFRKFWGRNLKIKIKII